MCLCTHDPSHPMQPLWGDRTTPTPTTTPPAHQARLVGRRLKGCQAIVCYKIEDVLVPRLRKHRWAGNVEQWAILAQPRQLPWSAGGGPLRCRGVSAC